MVSQFRAHTLAEIFADLYHAERSGVLRLKFEDIEKSVHFDRGIIVFAESPIATEDLGSTLLESGKLSAGALAEAKGSLRGASSVNDLARALVHRDLIKKQTVTRAMSTIVDDVVQSVFGWEDGQASFHEDQLDETLFETDILSTVEVILRGVSRMATFDPIFEAMRTLENRLQMRTPTPIPIERLTLSASQGFIISRMDGNTTLADLISMLPTEEEEAAARFVFGLLVLGVLEYDPPVGPGPFRVSDVVRDHEDRKALELLQEQRIRQQYEQVRGQNPHDVLGVKPGAGFDQIEGAYAQLKSECARESLLPRIRDRFKTELSVIESRLIEAYLTLTKPTRGASHRSDDEIDPNRDKTLEDFQVRVEMDIARTKVEVDRANQVADTYFAKGRKCLREGDFHNAIQFTKLAISHNPSDARYFSMLGDCLARNPGHRWQRLAEENYTRATQLDPWNAEYWVSLGRLYKRRGMKLRARKNFEEALKLAPNRGEVQRELAALE